MRFKYPTVIFGNALGDHLLALPALRALASLFPSRLALICMPGFRRVFFSDLRLRSVCEVEMRRRGRGRVFDAAAVAKRIGKCDLFLSLNPWRSASLDRLVALLSPALSVGFSPAFQVAILKLSDSSRERPYKGQSARLKAAATKPKARPSASMQHEADSAFRVPANLDPSLRLEDFAVPPRLPVGASARVRQFLRVNAPGKRVLAVHNETKIQKRWPRERLSKFLSAFLERHPDFVVFMLDFRKPRRKRGKFEDRIIHPRGLPLPYAFAVLREGDLFLGVDSCMLHAADLFRVPGVGLFGPTEPRRWGFRFARHRHVRDVHGLKYIRESRVLRALESVLRETRSDR
jgi:ADP-heptose:LPS heptosyltransferase